MSALSVNPPFPIFTDSDGTPLENGYIWIGMANLDPQGYPINVYWDAALTQIAGQPILTQNGYPVRNGSPTTLYVNADDYSIRVQNKNAATLYSALKDGERIASSLITFLQAGTGAVPRTVQSKLRDTVSVKDFGAVGDGTTDDTAAFTDALATGSDVFVPAGTYLITSALTVNLQRLYGQNGNKTTLRFNHSGGGFAITVTTSERGGGVDNFAMDAAVDGLKGLNMKGTVIARCNQVFINNFTDTSMKLGDTAGGSGIYWSKIGLVRIRLDSNKNGNTGLLIDGQAIPGSNDNSLEDVVIGGNFQRSLHIKGIGNSVKNGTIELTRGDTNVISMIYIEGSGNRVQDVYVEPVGTPPATLVEFGPNSSGNEVEVWPQYNLPYNASAAIIDGGAHNKVKLKRVGGNFRIGPEAEPSSNLLMNSAFRVWRDAENPRSWLFGTAGRISRVAPVAVGEPTTLRMTVADNNATIQSYLTDYFTSTSGSTPYDLEYLKGKPVIAGVWCKTTIAGAGGIKIGNIGGDGASYGPDRHSGSGNWELLTAHRQIPEASTRVWIELRSDTTNAARTGTVDFRDPFVILGSDVSYFTPKAVPDSGGQMFGDLEFPLDYSDKALGGVLRLNGYYLWVDTTGDLRIGATRPTNATWDSAGTVVGTQT